MLAFCLYAQFLLVLHSGDYDSKFLYILDQVEAGMNPFPLILTESIIGLDNCARTRWFSGSPILLEVNFLSSILCSLFHYYFCPFINLCRYGFMKSWDYWNLLEILPIIEPSIAVHDDSIRFLRMLGAGCPPYCILLFNGCVLGGDYNTW